MIDITQRVNYIKGLKTSVDKISKSENLLLDSGEEITIKPVPAIYLIEFLQAATGLLANLPKAVSDPKEILGGLLLSSGDLILFIVHLVVGDKIANMTMSDLVNALEIIIRQNIKKKIIKKIKKAVITMIEENNK